MIKPKFTLNIDNALFLNTELEDKIKYFGLKVLSFGAINKNSQYITAQFENIQFDQMIISIRDFLTNKNQEEFIEVFWSDLNKYSVLCQINSILNYLHDIATEDWDFWIFGDDWVIEYYHEGSLSYFENCPVNFLQN